MLNLARGDRLEGGPESQDAIEMSGRWRCGVTERVERVHTPVAEIYILRVCGDTGWLFYWQDFWKLAISGDIEGVFRKKLFLVRCRKRPKGVMTLCR